MSAPGFWKNKSLHEMSPAEWESLCDKCGHCCLVKLEDEETGKLYVTNVACRLLDTETCRCRDYVHRNKLVSQCLVLSVDKPELFKLLPESCAYRRLHSGLDLEPWHPLISGSNEAIKLAGGTVCEFAISEEYVHPEQLQDHIIQQLDDD